MQIQSYDQAPHSGTLILQYSSYAEKDIQSSVDLTIKFLSALQRWLYLRSKFSHSTVDTFAPAAKGGGGLLSRPTRCFAKRLSEHTAGYSNPKRLQRHTVIRSAFVYKKTREQFGLRMRTYRFRFRLTKFQKNLFLTWICQLKLPAELTLRFY